MRTWGIARIVVAVALLVAGGAAPTGCEGDPAAPRPRDGAVERAADLPGLDVPEAGNGGAPGSGGALSEVGPADLGDGAIERPADAPADVLADAPGDTGGATACGPGLTCAPGAFCLHSSFSGGPCLPRPDGGPCPEGTVPTSCGPTAGCVSHGESWSCQPKPSSCSGAINCACAAATVCTTGCACSSASSSTISCSCAAP